MLTGFIVDVFCIYFFCISLLLVQNWLVRILKMIMFLVILDVEGLCYVYFSGKFDYG